MTDQRQTMTEVDPHAITCAELVEIVTAYLDNSLPETERQQFEAHVEICDGCRHHVEQIRMTIVVVGSVTEKDLSPDARERLLGAFRSWKSTSPR